MVGIVVGGLRSVMIGWSAVWWRMGVADGGLLVLRQWRGGGRLLL